MATLGGILGGLQSRKNPGMNMAPGAYTYRSPGPTTSVLSSLPGARPGGGTAMGGNVPGRPVAPPLAPPARPAAPPALPAVAAPLPAAPTSSLQTFDQWLANNGQWSQQQAQSNAARNTLMAQFGWVRDASGRLVRDTHAAPDSALAGLDLDLGRNVQTAAQRSSNRGTLFSGATINEVDKATQAYETGVARAQTSLLQNLAGVDQQDLNTKIALDPSYEADVAQVKVDDPARVIAHFAGLAPGQAVASIDAYLAKYKQYLKPNELAEFARQRQLAWTKFSAPKPAPKPAAPKPATKKPAAKKKPPAKKIHTGGVAGGHAK